jgi:hypothetical protein
MLGRWSPSVLLAAALACGTQPPAATGEAAGKGAGVDAPAKPPPPEPLPALRTGTRELARGSALAGAVAARASDATHEYLELTLPLTGEDLSLDIDRLHVELDGAAPGDLAVVATGIGSSEARVLVRRVKRTDAGDPSGALIGRRWQDGENVTVRSPFSAKGAAGAKADDGLKQRWVEGFASLFADRWRFPHPWAQFAAGRVRALLPGGVTGPAAGDAGFGRPAASSDLSTLMDTTTGVMSMQEALQHDRGLRLTGDTGKRTVPVAELELPALDAHPFEAMRAKLANPQGGTPEPLASAVPAEFWYARVDDIRLLLRLLDEADTWITPVVQILQDNPEDRRLAERYQRQLGLRRTGLARVLGHTVVGAVALTGSDPYLREGSDVTMIFSVKQPEIFAGELTKFLDEYRGEVPGIVTTTREHAGVTITEHRDPTGAVRQQRASVGDRWLVSNSPRAVERVIDAIQGKAPRLADEPDLQYMLARDPGAHPAFAFLSDKFIAAVIGPQQKVLAARRQQALAELLTPGYAALLHGWLLGRAPADRAALVASGLLAADELKHADGGEIAFEPGGAASSAWGRPSALTPLIDLPPVTTVSEAEQRAYETFTQGYQQYWKQFIDPVAIRVDVRDEGGTATAEVDVRILPLISATDYSEIESIVGATRVRVAARGAGLEGVWAVGKDARLRGDLDGLMRAVSGKSDIGIGWLGDWVLLGVEDRAALVELLAKFDDKVQLAAPRPKGGEFADSDLWRRLGKFPVYAAAEVKNPAALIATLTAIKATLNDVAPGMVDWSEVERYRDLAIVRVGVSRSAPLLPNRDIADAVALHYAQTGSAIALALDVSTLHTMIDRMLDERLPKGGEGEAQFVVEGHSDRGRPLWTALLWMIQGQANTAQASARRSAEILLRGDPALQGDAAALARRGLDYFGFTPVTAYGTTEFTLTPGGAGDPKLGSDAAPVFVDLPVPGSPVERLMQRLTGLRGEVSFDKEPEPAGANARSLHTRFSIHLGPEN